MYRNYGDRRGPIVVHAKTKAGLSSTRSAKLYLKSKFKQLNIYKSKTNILDWKYMVYLQSLIKFTFFEKNYVDEGIKFIKTINLNELTYKKYSVQFKYSNKQMKSINEAIDDIKKYQCNRYGSERNIN